jgi:alpha-N-arabinofuranosidase
VVIQINTEDIIGRIRPELHGQFIEFLGSCIDGGIWVGEDSPIPNMRGIRLDVLDALKRLQPPLLRWPGGCYADRYHWRDGIGPRDQRPITFNENFGTYELDRHQFGTDEFLSLCEQVGAQPWISANMLTGTPREMAE